LTVGPVSCNGRYPTGPVASSRSAERAGVSPSTLSGTDFQELEEVKGLIARGQHVGVLTYAEVATAAAELGLEENDVEQLHGLLERCEIELVEEIDPATGASMNIERAPEKRTRGKARLDLRPEGTTDGLQLFLKGIGKVRLLSAQEEVDLAKRIERGSFEAKWSGSEVRARIDLGG
jgi:RNA polymerase primary sigma factor